MKRMYCVLGLAAVIMTDWAMAEPGLPDGWRVVKDQDYGGQGNARQSLDLFLPAKPPATPMPLIVFVHGGGWEGGSKEDGRVLFPLLADGKVAGASIGYRLTSEARWPAQIHDTKAALRWLGTHGEAFGYDPKKIALFGISAGGHLVSLLGTSQGVAELEGRVGVKDDAKPVPAPALAAVANYCGVTDFLTFPGKGSVIDAEDLNGPIAKLFGGPMSRHLDLAKIASPVTHITPNDPPFLHIHGTKDTLVPYAQVEEFDQALEKAGVTSTVLTGKDGGHVFVSEDLYRKLRAFFGKHLLGSKEEVAEGPVDIK